MAKEKKYSPEIRKELRALAQLAQKNERHSRLESLAQSLNSWQKKKLSSEDAFKAVQDANRENTAFDRHDKDSDLSLPVVRALAEGFLKPQDISPATKLLVDVLLRVDEII